MLARAGRGVAHVQRAAATSLAAIRPASLLQTSGAPFAAHRRGGASSSSSSGARSPAASAAASTPTKPSLLPLPTATSSPSWTVRMLYDGECALCMKEVDFLRKRDAPKGLIDFVDIAGPSYDAAQNCGLDYETAMARIHALRPDGSVLVDIAVFRALYEAVGMGWVYAITATPAVERAANGVYGFWAKYRTQVTGREGMAAIFAARRRRLAAEAEQEEIMGSECRVDGSGCGDEAPAATAGAK